MLHKPYDQDERISSDFYAVHLMPDLSPSDLAGSWTELMEQRSFRWLGNISVPFSALDLKNMALDLAVLDRIPSEQDRRLG